MFVLVHGQFLSVQLADNSYGQNAFTAGYAAASAWQAQVHDRMVAVPVAPDAQQQAQYTQQLGDLQALAARHAAEAYWTGQAQTVDLGRLQLLWAEAQKNQLEKNAARILYLLLAARHRGATLDVVSAAASLQRSCYEVLAACQLLSTYGAIRFGTGQVPNPADTSGWQDTAAIALVSDPPDLSRLGPFADALWRTGEVLGAG